MPASRSSPDTTTLTGLRTGTTGVIYEVIDGQLVILVVGAGHRREIYRAMS
jgi:mRNA-degrading endonuclease RelE of RelBE toxin-antitoxin system